MMAFLPQSPLYGQGVLTPDQVLQRQRQAQSMISQGSDTSPVGHWAQGLARLAQGWIGGMDARAADQAEQEGIASAQEAMSPILAALTGGSPASSYGTSNYAPTGDIGAGIVETAAALGMDPLDLATIISYETAGTFDPAKAGPTTQWGQHRGLIQFGEPQAQQYGVNWDDPLGSQLGPDGAVANYFKDRGYQPGMGLMDAYSIVNAGAPGRYSASDANNGGAPGTVADKVNSQMAGHRKKATALLGGDLTSTLSTQGPPSGGGDIISALMKASANPWARQQYGGVIDALLGSEIQQRQQASDPYRQLQMQKARLEMAQMQNPKPVFEGGQWWNINGGQPTALTEAAPDITTLQQNLAAAGLQPGTPEYQAAIMQAVTKPQTQINMGDGAPGIGKLSTDYGYVLDETGKPRIDPATGLPTAAPVPGSPAAAAAAAASTKEEARDAQAASSASVVLQDIDKAIGQVSGWTAGMGSRLSAIPGTDARDLSGSLDTIKANIGFDRLQQMREASPTGGALGGIAVQELMMLQAVLGSLDQAQSPGQLHQNLQRLKQVYEPIARKAAAYPNAADYGFGSQHEPSNNNIDNLLEKYR